MNTQIKSILDIHADDYGISQHSCDNILTLLDKNCLNSLSILPNMQCFNYAVQKLKEYQQNKPQNTPHISIHLNFMEGRCCAPITSVPDLVDKEGFFKISWGKLLLWNYNPCMRSRIMHQLEAEIMAQTRRCLEAGIISANDLHFDSHQHTHMIPLVFRALCNVCSTLQAEGNKTTFIRNTQDPLLPYCLTLGGGITPSLSNVIKCLILNFYSAVLIRKQLKKAGRPLSYLCGVFFSGHMDYDRLIRVLPRYCSRAHRQNRTVELLFHPGTVLQTEISREFVKPDFNTFHLSQNRKTEYDSIIQINEYLQEKQ